MKILAIKRVITKVGKPSILVQTATGNHWPTPGQWKSTGASQTLDNYVGGDIDVEYFKEGELLFDGETTCTKDDTILKSVYATPNPKVLAEALAIESAKVAEDFMDRSALFTQARIAAKAKAANAPAKAATKLA